MVRVVLALVWFSHLSILIAPDSAHERLDVEEYTVSGNTEPEVSLKVVQKYWSNSTSEVNLIWLLIRQYGADEIAMKTIHSYEVRRSAYRLVQFFRQIHQI